MTTRSYRPKRKEPERIARLLEDSTEVLSGVVGKQGPPGEEAAPGKKGVSAKRLSGVKDSSHPRVRATQPSAVDFYF